MKFFKFKKKNLKVLLPSNLKATQRKLTKAEPSRAIAAEVIRELGSGRKKSRRMPIKGAPITIDVRECPPVVDSPPKAPEELDSPQM
jgi:hypothetical protein